jgi:hypothetical protein
VSATNHKMKNSISKVRSVKKLSLYSPSGSTTDLHKASLQDLMKKTIDREIVVKKKALDKERRMLRQERKKYSEMLQTDVNQNNEFFEEIELLK